jgi:predicted RNA-binding Zn-ribbon protein involved in translation (DUF1610 family)
MAEEMAKEPQKCGSCGKDAWFDRDVMAKCSACGIPLCLACSHPLEKVDHSKDVLGVTTNPLNPGQSKELVCPKCLDEVDLAYPQGG